MAPTSSYEEKVLEEAYSATPNYDVDYNDERFGKVESEKNQALTELEQTYGGMVGSADKFYDDLKNQTQQWADKQAQIQQENTDFAIEKIEQQKEQAQKDYIKEQSGAYVDWQKQSNQYGVEAEKMASAGLTSSGYSESSQVAMYNQYQNRVATAREVLAQAKLNYDNGIKEAQLQNNAALAEIYANAYLKQAELALEGFQYKNQLILDQANKKLEIDQMYYSRWQDVLNQINTENAMAEEIRQYNETMKWNTEQKELDRQHDSAEALLDRQHQEKLNTINNEFKAKQDELQRKHDKELLKIKNQYEKEQLTAKHENDLAVLEKQKQNQIAILNHEYSLKKAQISGDPSGYRIDPGEIFVNPNGTAIAPTSAPTSSSSKEPTVNMDSVLALGYGPIGAKKLAELVSSGIVTMYQKDGQIYYKKKITDFTPTILR